jgi:ADP-dependent NAD(P)H-hydrate dehydratase / NAD(P)H-hydrate epimerase
LQPVLTAEQMREADRRTIEDAGVPGATLMERAGAAVARAVRERFSHARRIAVLCGKGNNGGDGFVAARYLGERAPAVLLFARRDEVKGDAAGQLAQLEPAGIPVHEIVDAEAWARLREQVLTADVVVDALLGTGLRAAPAGLVAEVLADLAAPTAAGQPPLVAVDLVSGLSSDNGAVPFALPRAAVTVTFAALKHAHVLPPAHDLAGEVVVVDIGIPHDVIAAVVPTLWLLEDRDAAAAYPPREGSAHKGDFGHVLALAGSRGKSGAAVLCGTAALRAGAGLVTVATPEAAQPIVAAARPELMTEALRTEGALRRGLELAGRSDAAVVGPGWGSEGAAGETARGFVARCPIPLVVDADALNAFAPFASHAWPRRQDATVLTPHPGEMARLLGRSTAEVQADRLGAARELARASGAVVVLKGQRTLVTEPGGRTAVNPTGNAGMAKGGTGDALAGGIAALLARGCDAWTAATAGVFVHGRAGDLAAERVGQESMLAGDLIDSLGAAIRSLAVSNG